jgi:aspartyl-tRNA(Asn)/glutamyl-tRNA(Gln) amidotransferase subunit C
MKITEKDVRYVADLANLELSPEELAQFVPQLDAILGYMEKLNELDTAAVEPMAQVLYEASEKERETGTLREDRDRAGFPTETALANAPESGAGHFKVPKVFER